jgi:acyl-CoA synthetase (AMP-forming)/AMP-acid ligase II
VSSNAQLADLRIEEALIRRASTDGGVRAVEDMDRAVTYGELLGAALAARDLIVRSGARPGDHVSVFLDKSLESVAYGYGVWLAGGVLVPIAPTLRRQHVEYILQHSESRLLLSTEGKLRRAGFDAMPANLVPVPAVEPRAPESLPELLTSEATEPAALRDAERRDRLAREPLRRLSDRQ